MNDARMQIHEKQLDALAGRVAQLEDQVRQLLTTLSAPPVLARLGIEKYMFESLRSETGLAGSVEESRHERERREALDQAAKDALLKRLSKAESLARTTEQSFAAALDAVSKREAG
jgi:hypothetical protein